VKDGFSRGNSVLLGVIIAGISIVIVLGSLLLSFTEGTEIASLVAFPTLENVDIITPRPSHTSSPTPVPSLTLTSELVHTLTSTLSPSPTPTLTLMVCEPPPGWVAHTVQSGDTLRNLLGSSGLSPQELADANCLSESRLQPDTILYLPPESPVDTPVQCGAPGSWVTYIVQRGDTLYSIARRVNSTVNALKQANCLTSNNIYSGQKLYVPRYPISIPSATYLPPPTLPPASPTPLPPTDVPAPTPTDGTISKRTPAP
jgi:LysM repeat protein